MRTRRYLSVCLTATGFFISGLQAQEKKDLSFGQIFKGEASGLSQPLPAIRGWADDTHYIEMRSDAKAWKVDAQTGNATPYEKAPDGASVAVIQNDIIYTSDEGIKTQLTHDTTQERNPTLSPDGKYVAFTHGNDLYSIEIATKKQTRYTTDGTDVIYNGWASWVYYEEILGRPSKYRAFWWSPDSKHIAYMHFNDSKVPVFPIYSATGQHGYLENTRYPEAGDTNPAVKVGIVPVTGGNTVWSDFNENDDQYFGTPFWTADGHLWLQWMNRGQDNLKIYDVNLENGSKKEVYDEKQPTWIDWKDDMTFLENGKGFIMQSDKTGWAHLYWYNMDGSLKKQLTSGNWTVNSIASIDNKNLLICFVARKEASTRTDLYQVNMKTGVITRLTFGDYFHSTMVSPNGSFFITTYSNLATPPVMALLNNKGKVIRELGHSKGPQFDQYNLAGTKIRYYKTRDGLELPMTITMPLHMQEGKKYPILISIYGGPNAGTVYDNWKSSLPAQWLAKEGIIQVAIDNRSSGQLGKMGMNYIHRQLGRHEIEDYMDAATWLRAQPWTDTSKVCITGGSFGGYMTCMALTYGAGVFTHGMANYSVTDWQLYDSHYTERYMDTPAENPDGYRITSPIYYADRYKGMLRITHGTMDDNVHIQNSIQFVDKLENLGKHFEFMVYPGERHGWRTSIKNRHSDNEMYRFIYRYLLEQPFPNGFE
ncbi:prolyl oligopeptidase family serine peptidase [Chitinophaga oryziterrae]|uniref:Prolyl oligopeptidase family serine peptidase n=1 Tax=Chitinophaga oryziterrae TaxID=1031224 RepID=A0A6N8JCI5_9BACT|nr:S9 family peptidase [Chitinophaga oryziterrae]MVT42644.1 prolyl oligopeptidase family serine peptidase [Chitinophaga oryziterrae]